MTTNDDDLPPEVEYWNKSAEMTEPQVRARRLLDDNEFRLLLLAAKDWAAHIDDLCAQGDSDFEEEWDNLNKIFRKLSMRGNNPIVDSRD